MIWLGLLLLLFFGVVMLVLNSSYVQTRMGQELAQRLTAKWGLEVNLDRLNIDFPNSAILEGLVVYDLNSDTLLYVRSFSLTTQRLIPSLDTYRFKSLKLDGALLHIQKLDTLGNNNFSFLADSDADSNDIEADFEENTVNDSLRAFLLEKYFLSASIVELTDCRFLYSDITAPFDSVGLDYAHIDIADIAGKVSKFQISQDSLIANIVSLSCLEKSGFNIGNLRSKVKVDGTGIYASELQFTTSNSLLIGDFVLGHSSWDDYTNFLDGITWNAHITESSINLADIGYFVDELYQKDFNLLFNGKLRGSINDLKGRNVRVQTNDNAIVSGSFDIKGITDFDNAFLDFRIKSSATNFGGLESLAQEIFGKSLFNSGFSEELQRAGNIQFNGAFTGFSNDFVAYGKLQTDVGYLDLDINLENDSLNDLLVYRGNISTVDLNIGKLMSMPDFGMVTAQAELVAYSRETLVEATIQGEIASLDYLGYAYKQFEIDGTISNKKFIGELKSRDPNVNLDFFGTVDFSEKRPIVDFYADIYNLDLTNLNLIKSEQPISFSSRLQLKAAGLQPNDVQGILEATDTYICYGDSVLTLDVLKLTAVGDIQNRKIALTSDIADFHVIGAFDAYQFSNNAQRIGHAIFPTLVDSVDIAKGEDFQFSIHYKKANLLSGFLVDGLYIAPNTTAYGSYNSDQGKLGLFLRSDQLSFDNANLDGLTIDVNLLNDDLDGQVYISSADYEGYHIENVNIEMKGKADSVLVQAGWLNYDESSKGEIAAQLNVLGRKRMNVELKPSELGNKNWLWKLEDSSVIEIDSTSIFVDNLLVKSKDQLFTVHGFISEDPNDVLAINLSNIDLAELDSSLFFNKRVAGVMNVQGTLKDAYGDKLVHATAEVNEFKIGKYSFGDIHASSRYLGDNKSMLLMADLMKADQEMLKFNGTYRINQESPLEGILTLNEIDLDLLNAFQIPQVSSYTGSARGEIAVKGDFVKPQLKGYIDLNQARFKIEYLNAFFEYSDRIRVEDGWLGIDYKPLYDGDKRKGYLVASAFHDNFQNWSYDVDVEVSNFFLLNTTIEMNDTYYGTAYGTGNIQLGGYDGFLEINIDATTEKGTSLKLPLDDSDDVTMENFVYFINPNQVDSVDREVNLQGVQLRLNIDATPDAEVQLIFDQKAGDIIRSRGVGKITFEISPTGEFLMFGRYEIEEGSYLFTLKNLVNKQFELRKGGVIGWYGDPYQADIDLSASYLVRTPLYPIMIENQDLYRGRENVYVVLNLQEKLMNPAIKFNIELPQATETERAQLASVVNTTQQLNQQVFSLLILNRFLPVQATSEDQSITVTGVGGFGSATTSDFVSTQISNWLSEISNEFDIGVNYRPGDQISNQEIAVALSTQLFNERLYVRGSVGVTSASETQYTQGQNGILGDFMVEYSITADGKIRLKVFNETNPYELVSTSSSIYTQGIGLVYQEDFDTLDEFFKEVKSLFSKDTVKRAEPVQP